MLYTVTIVTFTNEVQCYLMMTVWWNTWLYLDWRHASSVQSVRMADVNNSHQTERVALIVIYFLLLYMYIRSCSESSERPPDTNIESLNVVGL